MLLTYWQKVRWQVVLTTVGVLVGSAAQAQVPAQLLGQWELRQIAFVANQTVSHDIMERMDNPGVAELNQEVAAGAAHLLVEFRPDGTYQFSVQRPGQPASTEAGTYTVRARQLLAQSPGMAAGSSFDGQRIVQLSRRKLVVEFPVGEELPGVVEEIEYRRVGQ